MSYLLTNSTALTALQNLTMTQNALSQTQTELSTGLSVNTAADNASYWSISQTMQSDNGALSSVSSALNVQGSMLSTFTSALNQSISVVNNIKNDLVEAQQPGANLNQIGSDILAQQNSLVSIASASTFNSQNWLTTTATSTSLVSSYTNSTGVNTISVSTGAITLISGGIGAGKGASSASGGILGTAGASSGITLLAMQVTKTGMATGANTGSLSTMLADVNTVITNMENAAAALGAASNSNTTQTTFVSSMQTNLTNGVASLVDANMNQVSTRLQALQTQQQLGVQSLSIANQSSQMILKLFQ